MHILNVGVFSFSKSCLIHLNEVWLVILTYLTYSKLIELVVFKEKEILQYIYLLLTYTGLVCGFEHWFILPHFEANTSFNA